MKNIRKFVASAFSSVILASTIVSPALAAEQSNVDVTIATEATEMSVTVPSELPLVFKSDGTNAIPTNWNITNNNKNSSIALTQMNFEQRYGWYISYVKDYPLTADEKTIRMYAGTDSDNLIMAGMGGLINLSDQPIEIAPNGGTQNIVFDVDRPDFSSSQDPEKAFDLVLSFEWC